MNLNKITKKSLISIQLLLLLLIVSCGKNTEEKKTCFNSSSVINGKVVKKSPESIGLKNSCGESIEIEKSFPAIVSLRTSKGICTGTFINDYTVLTAAHCFSNGFDVDENGQVDVAVSVSVEDIKAVSTQVIINPKFYQEGLNYNYDSALVFVPRGTAKMSIPMYEGELKVDDRVYSVGFGNNRKFKGKFVGSGIKRWGENVISGFNKDVVMFEGTSVDTQSGVDVSLGAGDSGGPLLFKNKVIGIASNVHRLERFYSRYVRVDSIETKTFLKKAFSLYNPNLKNNKESFLKLCKHPLLKTPYYKYFVSKLIKTYGLKSCEELSYVYPLYGSLDLSGADLEKMTNDQLLGKIRLFKNVRTLKLNNTGLKSLDLFKKMDNLEAFEIKDNPFSDYESLKHFKNLKHITSDNSALMKKHAEPNSGLGLQGRWKRTCSFSEDQGLYRIVKYEFTNIMKGKVELFSDENCLEKVVIVKIWADYQMGEEKYNYRSIDFKIFKIKIEKLIGEDKGEMESTSSHWNYDIFKIKGNNLYTGDLEGKNNKLRKFRPTRLNETNPFVRFK